MGSFNKIGFISNLPITSGDKTVLIFTTVNGYSAEAMGGVTYSDDAYVPTLLPIFGEYDDYGKIDCIVRDTNVEFIENFFGLSIDEIVEIVDDNAVGRGDPKSAPKHKDIFDKMVFCLEHQGVYEKMASTTRPSFKESNIGEYWLDKLGWIKDGKTDDDRYKYKWIHPQINDGYIACDGNWSNFNAVDGMPKNPIFDFYSIYHPCHLVRVMEKLDIKVPITQEDKDMCMIDLSYDITGEICREKIASFGGNIKKYELRDILSSGRWPKGIYSIPELISNRQSKLSDIVKNIIAGINSDVPEMDGKVLCENMKKNICDYMRFNWYLSNLNGKYYPSNYGSQETSIERHLEISKVYSEIIDAKIAEQKQWQEEDEFDEV